MNTREWIKLVAPGWLLAAARKGSAVAQCARDYPTYRWRDGKASRLERVTLDITYRCNLRCVMCPIVGPVRSPIPPPRSSAS